MGIDGRIQAWLTGVAENRASDDDGGELLFSVTSPLHRIIPARKIGTPKRGMSEEEDNKDEDEDEHLRN